MAGFGFQNSGLGAGRNALFPGLFWRLSGGQNKAKIIAHRDSAEQQKMGVSHGIQMESIGRL